MSLTVQWGFFCLYSKLLCLCLTLENVKAKLYFGDKTKQKKCCGLFCGFGLFVWLVGWFFPKRIDRKYKEKKGPKIWNLRFSLPVLILLVPGWIERFGCSSGENGKFMVVGRRVRPHRRNTKLWGYEGRKLEGPVIS